MPKQNLTHMQKHILFLVQGMGKHQHLDWHLPIVAGLCNTFKTYTAFLHDGIGLDAYVEFVPITYNAVFTNVLNTWQQNPSELLAIPPQEHFKPGDIVTWLNNASPTAKNFFWSDIAGVLAYRFLPKEQQEVRLSVMQQLKDRLAQETTTPTCSILAHGLGTSVIHDSLHLLYTHPWKDMPACIDRLFTFQNITMLANTSRALASNIPDTGNYYDKVYHSMVKPGGAVVNYTNCRHQFDPIPSWVYRFNPPWPTNEHYQNILIDHVSRADVHDLMHYLDNPAIHIPLFQSFLGKYAIPKVEYDQKMALFKTNHALTLSDLNPKLKQLIDLQTEAEMEQHIGGFFEVLLAYSSTLS